MFSSHFGYFLHSLDFSSYLNVYYFQIYLWSFWWKPTSQLLCIVPKYADSSSSPNCSLFYLSRVYIHLMLKLKTSKFLSFFYPCIQIPAMSYYYQKCLLLFSIPTALVYFFITSRPDYPHPHCHLPLCRLVPFLYSLTCYWTNYALEGAPPPYSQKNPNLYWHAELSLIWQQFAFPGCPVCASVTPYYLPFSRHIPQKVHFSFLFCCSCPSSWHTVSPSIVKILPIIQNLLVTALTLLGFLTFLSPSSPRCSLVHLA